MPSLEHRNTSTAAIDNNNNSTSTSHKPTCKADLKPPINMRDGVLAILLFALAFPIRMQNLDSPSQVVFDEVHFGTFANHYIRERFFFDVHPPLAKILIALAGRVAGYQGDFDFSRIGNDYSAGHVPYVAMRAQGALLGTLLVPIAYFTLRFGGHSIYASAFAALAVCYENSLVTNSRLILLDVYLLFFIAMTILCWNRFFHHRSRPFRLAWWFWLALTGVNLGFTVSCKWVGLFTIGTIGLSTVMDLWRILGDLQVSKKALGGHFLARILCLILLPLSVYVSIFYVHLKMLPHSGDGDVHMSAAFQHSLAGNEIPDSPIDVAYGSKITLRHLSTNGGYLHSHPSAYQTGSKQQQITLYPYRDENNWWIIRKLNSTLDAQNEPADKLGKDNATWLQWVRHGDIIRLEHVATSPRKLHSHDESAPMTDVEYHKEVSGYGFPDFEGDANDWWRVEIVDDPKERLETLRTRFRLVHMLQSCALFSHEVQLPDWGFGQQEVTCMQQSKKPKTMWMIEETRNDLLPDDTRMVNYLVPGFWGKFIELHKVMWKVNEGLTQSHPYQSRPSAWPMLRRGISFWANQGRHIYFLGNPIVYWMTTVAVFNFLILWAFFQVRAKLGYTDDYKGRRAFFEQSAGFYLMAWALHYLPFYLMNRQLFLHHYLPALYFAILVLATAIDLAIARATPRRRLISVLLLALGVIAIFYQFEALTYGKEWTREACEQQQWLPSWQFDCGSYQSQMATALPGKKVVLDEHGSIIGDEAMAESLLSNQSISYHHSTQRSANTAPQEHFLHG
ncbi:glycosyltransferase family 39 protein [Lichtheimia corymbifera JMRC:FSU:9682]|uniref:Dolichyl-phosphate-mannose--protein mannosyltransferase n=1 Tax=Lichtheimia corymbifera JMRC:FSU:9682 TaxID=1263082 RepID=A0A068RKX7_9FUNG|nr:glycosyltransferase family 39 protein [Lichtheimia corymbifera JMRC:FSU:9682]